MVDLKRGKYYKRLNWVATLATFLTTILLAMLCFSSFVPSSTSGDHTNIIVNALNSLMGSDQGVEITSLSLSKSNVEGHKYNYIGDTCMITVGFNPSSAPAGTCTFASSDENIATVNDDGLVTFVGLGTAKITATLNENKSIKKDISLTCYGVAPSSSTKITLKTADFKVGQTSSILLNDGQTSDSAASFEISDPSVLYLSGSKVWAEREGSCYIKAIFEDGTSASQRVTIKANTGLVVPTAYNIVEDRTFLSGEKLAYSKLVSSIEPSGANSLIIATSSDEDIVKVSGTDLVFGNAGSADVILTSAVNPALSERVTVTVEKIMPTALSIDMSDSVVVNNKVALKATHDPVAYSGDVEWTVVKGNAVITDDGKLMTYFFGDVVIGARSTLNPDLYVEKTISVKLYSSFYMFVRKILGHFSLFALLGFGIFATCFLLAKPHWFSFLISPGIAFLAASFCELCQNFGPGRYFAVSDVFVNFSGTILGMLIGIVLCALIAIVWYVINKENFKNFVVALKDVSIYSVFFKPKDNATDNKKTDKTTKKTAGA